jgi:hypothetical protein
VPLDDRDFSKLRQPNFSILKKFPRRSRRAAIRSDSATEKSSIHRVPFLAIRGIALADLLIWSREKEGQGAAIGHDQQKPSFGL